MRWDVWWRIHERLPQQGPGSETSTLRALAGVESLPERSRILDLGCGPGRQTRTIARATGGSVVAIDTLRPFLCQLREHAEAEGLADRIHPVRADMGDLGLSDAAFDLLWSEGAIYNLGFEEGLGAWRRLLRPGGACAVSECSWLAEPPARTRAFWEEEYPGMANVEENLTRAERAGFEVLSHFPLPISDWDAYYDPIRERVEVFRREYSAEPDALETLDAFDRESGMLARSDDSYSYVFYLLRRR